MLAYKKEISLDILYGIGYLLLSLAMSGIFLVILGFISYFVVLVVWVCFLTGWDYAKDLCGN